MQAGNRFRELMGARDPLTYTATPRVINSQAAILGAMRHRAERDLSRAQSREFRGLVKGVGVSAWAQALFVPDPRMIIRGEKQNRPAPEKEKWLTSIEKKSS